MLGTVYQYLGQGWGLLFLFGLQPVASVARMEGAFHDLPDLPEVVPVRDMEVREEHGGVFGFGVVEGPKGIRDHRSILPGCVLLFLAESHQQDALGGDIGRLMEYQGLTRFTVEIAGFEYSCDGAIGGRVYGLGGIRKLARLGHAEDQAPDGLLLEIDVFYAEVHNDTSCRGRLYRDPILHWFSVRRLSVSGRVVSFGIARCRSSSRGRRSGMPHGGDGSP
uniref:Uncharacterized protein n=1 Tax=Candidatus Kentrum sp. LFY TaxID=2126342 RepID=A0A450WFV7_9GAMM|nr:MAG: hypothetical protein BECKLFY1418C_GA0070996_101924 [Candidatus Kentron sp. LFY]